MPPVTIRGPLVLLALVLSLAACSGDGDKKKDPIFANTPTGENAKKLIRQLPKGLPGDHDNARYMRQPLIAPEIAAPEARRGS